MVDWERISHIWGQKGWGSGAMEEEGGGGERAIMEVGCFSWCGEVEDGEGEAPTGQNKGKREILLPRPRPGLVGQAPEPAGQSPAWTRPREGWRPASRPRGPAPTRPQPGLAQGQAGHLTEPAGLSPA